MRAPTAAAYLDERSVEAFLEKVRKGIYGGPIRRSGSPAKWLREKLDNDLRRSHRLPVVGMGREDLTNFF